LIKLILKLAIVALVANASWRVGSAYISHYKFQDSVQQATLFRGTQTDDVLRQKVFELASDYDIPIASDQVTLTTANHHTVVDGGYTRIIELAPGFRYPWPFSFHTDTLTGGLQ
jgi:hypothetical protein